MGPVTFVHQKAYLMVVERNISKKGEKGTEIIRLYLRQEIKRYYCNANFDS
jgi:hypothetical protein